MISRCRNACRRLNNIIKQAVRSRPVRGFMALAFGAGAAAGVDQACDYSETRGLPVHEVVKYGATLATFLIVVLFNYDQSANNQADAEESKSTTKEIIAALQALDIRDNANFSAALRRAQNGGWVTVGIDENENKEEKSALENDNNKKNDISLTVVATTLSDASPLLPKAAH
ncbi:MAG TPA: hypothetical protein VJL60_02020 [Gammaproteobacteria bacterium]|nr:hypothetical protein [Gammaproteobacteria bacterium]